MSKILSRSGDSLADVYDVEGSIAGIENLESSDVNLTHDMGEVIFSERVGARVLLLQPGAILQSVTFNVTFLMPRHMSRILGIQVTADVGARTQRLMVGINDGLTDIPLWMWETGSADDVEKTERSLLAGAGPAGRIFFVPMVGFGPSMAFGREQPLVVDQLVFRGESTAFGAGNLNLTAIVLVAHAQAQALSSRGLPVPSW